MLRFSIFPNTNPFPKTKEEKASIAKYGVSYPNEAVQVTANSEDDLLEFICNNTWSPFLFVKYRREDNFISTDMIAFDIDEGMDIKQAEVQVNKLGLAALCLPSPNHTEENPRFRLIFPLSRTITNPEEFRSTYAHLAEYFPVDPQCKDYCRFYFGSTLDDGFWLDGKLASPVAPPKIEDSPSRDFSSGEDILVGEELEEIVETLYGEKRTKIPEQVSFFLENAHSGLDGLWHTSFNRFVFTLSLQDIPFERIQAVAESVAPNPLDKHDLYLLERSYNDGQLKKDDDK